MEPIKISVEEAKRKFDTDERTVFVDTRAPEAWDTSEMKLPGAIRVSPHEVEQHLAEIPRSASIITYCT